MKNIELEEKRTVQDEIEKTIEGLGFDAIRLIHETDSQEINDNQADREDVLTDYIRWAGAKIVGIRKGVDGREDEKVEVGHISGRLMMFWRASNDRMDLSYVADNMNADIRDAASLLGSIYDDKEFYGGTGLLVEELMLKPAYRGRGLATIFLRRYIDWHASDLFAVITLPNADHFFHRKAGIEQRRNVDDPLFAADPEVGNKRLCAWCKSLGFKKSSSHDGYFVFDMDAHDPLWRCRKVGKRYRLNAQECV